MKPNTLGTSAPSSTTIGSESIRTIVAAGFIGFALVFFAGFSPASVLHNAAHDFRHVQNYPCH